MTEFNNTVIVDDFEYDPQRKQYILGIDTVQNWLKEEGLESLFTEMDQIRYVCSDRFYNYQYSTALMWPEDFAKKEYLLITVDQNVLDSRRAMLEDMKAIINNRSDLVELQHGVDFENHKLVEGFEEKMRKRPFSEPVYRVLNRNPLLSQKERRNLLVITDLGVGY